jgi:hypothetical protein
VAGTICRTLVLGTAGLAAVVLLPERADPADPAGDGGDGSIAGASSTG